LVAHPSRRDLEAALALENATERKLGIAAAVANAVADLGLTPVVVGGVAVELWTYGEYATGDIDLVMPYLPEIDERMASLGFEREGRHWTLPGSDVFVEAPGSALEHGEEAVEVDVAPGLRVLVLSPEDSLVARLHEFLGTGHSDSVEQSVLLLRSRKLDKARLDRRVAEEGLEATLAAVDQLAERATHGGQFETWELQEIARDLRHRELR
jgi:hypothetical protein